MKALDKYLHIAKTNMASQLVYVKDFFFRNIFYLFIVYIMMLLWKAIYGKGDNLVAGLTLTQMIWYLVTTELVTLTRANVFTEISETVKKGDIAYLISKPYHYLGYLFANSMGEIGPKFVTNGITAIFMGLLYVGPIQGFSMGHFPLIVLSIILGICLNYFIYVTLALSAFWIEENAALSWIYSKLIFFLGGMLIPLELLPEWIGNLSRRMPFAYVTYGPGRLAVDFSYERFFEILKWQSGYLLFFILLALLIYRRGVKELNVNGG